MKKALPFLGLICVLILSGCSSSRPVIHPTTTSTETQVPSQGLQEPVVDRQAYTSKSDAFSIKFPGLRKFQENFNNASVVFFSPITGTDSLSENVSIVKNKLSQDYTLDEYFAMTLEALTGQNGYAELGKSDVNINGLQGKKVIFTCIIKEQMRQFEQVLIIKDGSAYIITYTATEATFNDYIQDVDAMITSFSIL